MHIHIIKNTQFVLHHRYPTLKGGERKFWSNSQFPHLSRWGIDDAMRNTGYDGANLAGHIDNPRY